MWLERDLPAAVSGFVSRRAMQSPLLAFPRPLPQDTGSPWGAAGAEHGGPVGMAAGAMVLVWVQAHHQ